MGRSPAHLPRMTLLWEWRLGPKSSPRNGNFWAKWWRYGAATSGWGGTSWGGNTGCPRSRSRRSAPAVKSTSGHSTARRRLFGKLLQPALEHIYLVDGQDH